MKQKFKSAKEKKEYYEAREMEAKLLKKYPVKNIKLKTDMPNYKHRSSNDIITRPEVVVTSNSKKETVKYTGDLVKGISIIHKSCLQPIISKEEAIDVARMRR